MLQQKIDQQNYNVNHMNNEKNSTTKISDTEKKFLLSASIFSRPNSIMLLLICLTFLSSCSISKMRYSRGFNIGIADRFKKSDSKVANISKVAVNKKRDQLETILVSQNKQTNQLSDEKYIQYNGLKKISENPSISDLSQPEFIRARKENGIQIKLGVQKSRVAKNSSPTIGKGISIAAIDEPQSKKTKANRKLNILGLVSFFLLFTLYLWPIALLLGGISLRQFRIYPEKYKLKLLPILAVVAGIPLSMLIFLILLYVNTVFALILAALTALIILISPIIIAV